MQLPEVWLLNDADEFQFWDNEPPNPLVSQGLPRSLPPLTYSHSTLNLPGHLENGGEIITDSLLETYQRLNEIPESKATGTGGANIAGVPNGKLHGKTVAIKDNICVAGVPMMIGSRILEGYIPDVDATVVTRILDAGGRITGKAVCESLCNWQWRQLHFRYGACGPSP
ncbi:hypothetical protein OS493_035178 [Desmophyllum pertusum]|uniref:Amidase domain-containing protein n=1 Tax=Desmophyllum pertusum TaxID=174260 RepID=A0A9W9Y7R0_9CNID|nr:hypothetical protein OS493_035178 [Desmophyllum pertusum]